MSSNAKRAYDSENSDEFLEERSIPVPLKRRKYLDLIPPTQSKPTLTKQFNVIRSPFRHHYSALPTGRMRVLVIKKKITHDIDEPLQLELHLEDMASHNYESLSYEWASSFPRYPVILRDYTVPLCEQLALLKSTPETSPETRKSNARERIKLLIRIYLNRRSLKPQPHLDNKMQWVPKRLVRENLYNALLHFRRSKHDVRIWVDALCINQYSSIEKAEQIQRIADIYNNARHVRIWLGAQSEDTHIAMNFIKKLADFENIANTLADKDIEKRWTALTNLMRSRWFSRRWVIQEQAVAQKASLYCGHAKVDWNDFADALSIFRTKRDSLSKVFDDPHLSPAAVLDVFDGLGATSMVLQHVLRKDLEGKILERTKTLEELVSIFTPFASGDPRDTIYAVMSIARPQGILFDEIKPDYQKSLLDVYTEFVKFCVESSKSLDILCRHWAPVETILKALAPEENAIGQIVDNFVDVVSKLPSWIKQLDGSTYGTPENILRGRKHGDVFATLKPIYHASRGARAEDVIHVFDKKTLGSADESSDDTTISLHETFNGKLTVRGIILGKVRKLSNRISEGTLPREVFKMGGWRHSQQSDDHSVNELPDRLWRTLVANQGSDINPGFHDQPPSYFRRSCLYALQRESNSGDVNIMDIVAHDKTPEVVSDYLRKVQNVTRNRKSFLAGESKELFGLGPTQMQLKKDYVCIIFGCSVPVILRRVLGNPPKVGQERAKPRASRSSRRQISPSVSSESSASAKSVDGTRLPQQTTEYWRLIGECYVDGRMEGEALDSPNYSEGVKDFILV